MFPKTTVLGNFCVRGSNKYTKLFKLYKPFEIDGLGNEIKYKISILITYHIKSNTQEISSLNTKEGGLS